MLVLALIAKSSKHENAKQPHWAQAVLSGSPSPIRRAAEDRACAKIRLSSDGPSRKWSFRTMKSLLGQVTKRFERFPQLPWDRRELRCGCILPGVVLEICGQVT